MQKQTNLTNSHSPKIRSLTCAGAIVASLTLPPLESALAQSTNIIPQGPSISFTRTNDYRLYINHRYPDGTLSDYHTFTVKSICWAPTSIGTDPNANPLIYKQQFAVWADQDIALAAAMGANTLRTYYDFGPATNAIQILDKIYLAGLKVIIAADWAQYGQVASLSNLTNVVNICKDHPAVLGFSVGNEWDLPNGPGGTYYYGAFPSLLASAQFIQTAASIIKQLDPNHAVFTFMADPHIPGVHPLSPSLFPYQNGRPYTSEIIASICPAVDVWGFNVYRGASFGDLFIQYKTLTPKKPMMLGEFGADAYRFSASQVDQPMQAAFNAALCDEIVYNFSASRTNGCCAGVSAFELRDQWEKEGLPYVQNTGGEYNPGQPDMSNNEEYFGVADIHGSPRLAYHALAQRYKFEQAGTILSTNPVLSVTSARAVAEIKTDGKTVFSRSGGQFGARGINVGLLNPHTGMLYDMRSFDTYANMANFTALTTYLHNLPVDSIIMLAICDEGGIAPYGGTSPYTDSRVQTALGYLQTLGSTQVRNVRYWGAWAMITKKGQGKLAEDQRNPINANDMVSVTIVTQTALQINPRAENYPLVTITTPPQSANNWTMTIDNNPQQGGTNRIEGSTDLQTWRTLGKTPVPVPGGQSTWKDTNAPSLPKQFYRIYRED